MQLRPWGFDLADITVPVLLLHGGQDMRPQESDPVPRRPDRRG